MDASNRSLLIVEDDDRLRSLVEEAARRAAVFHSIIAVADGQYALDFISSKIRRPEPLPDFVLTDLSMPRVDGLRLLRELKARPETRDVPVAVMTSSDLPNDREDATAAGCCAFFHKPHRLDDIVLLIASLPQICGSKAPAVAHF